MTPLQVIMLGHRMRQAQIAFNRAMNGDGGVGKALIDMDKLEREFDAALEPYMLYVRATEQEDANVA